MQSALHLSACQQNKLGVHYHSCSMMLPCDISFASSTQHWMCWTFASKFHSIGNLWYTILLRIYNDTSPLTTAATSSPIQEAESDEKAIGPEKPLAGQRN
ncbi:hypothetical protein AAHE18_06G254000 [Arachis hypogaea]